MRPFHTLRTALTLPLVCVLMAAIASAQLRSPAPPIIYMPPDPAQQQTQQQAQPQPQAQPGQPQPPTAAAQSGPAAPNPKISDTGGFMLNNVSLIELIDILARKLKINYLLDPRVKGSVTIYTYGEVKQVDLMPLLQTVLRVNGATIVQVGDLYRIVPLNAVAPLPMTPAINADPKTLPDDERVILNMVFLKYATVGEVTKLITPFLGEGATLSSYDPANLLVILDNSRNMRRTMELLAMFDSDTFAGQRVRLFDVTNGRPTDVVKELDQVFKAYAFSEKNSGVRFLPIDRINTIIAVAPNPGIFAEVDKWLKKLDIPVKITAGAVNNYVYRLKYGRSETVAMAIMGLYSGNPMAMVMMMSSMSGSFGGMSGSGSYPGAMGGGYAPMSGASSMMGSGYGSTSGYGNYGSSNITNTGGYSPVSPVGGTPAGTSPVPGAGSGTSDLTGSYLGQGAMGGSQNMRVPHVVPNPFDNTLLVQGTPQEWEQISRLLEQLDVPPRQVLIDAKIYELDLNGAFSSGVASYLQKKNDSASSSSSGSGSGTATISRTLAAAGSGSGLTLSAGALVGKSHELLGVLTAAENTSRTKVISAPSLIATDSIPATLNVGEDVPVLTSQAVTGVQQSGSSLFTNTVSNRSTGVTLNILARVNSSGIVTMVIQQDVSTPQAPAASSGIQSPSFQRRSVQTQVTVQDGDTIAIAGIIQESDLRSSGGVPVLHRIPFLGSAFGAKSTTKARTELIIFLTPRVIYDTNQIAEATDEIKGKLKKLQKSMPED